MNQGKRLDDPYKRISGEIRLRIESGQLRAGDRIPSTRQISREWGVAIATATKALGVLRGAGLVRVVPGVGIVVKGDVHPPDSAPTRSGNLERGPDTELSAERIIRCAIKIADAEGLGTVSMRRVATELGVPTMSLYGHLRGKNELVLAMANTVLGDDPPPPARPSAWRDQLEALAQIQWAGYRRHPWLASVISISRPQLLPNGIAHTEWALGAMEDFGWDASTRFNAAVALLAYVNGLATNFEMQAQAQRDSGISDARWMESQEGAFEAVLASGRYPALSDVTRGSDVNVDLDGVFEFGLQCLLDGYGARRSPDGSTVPRGREADQSSRRGSSQATT